jgi:hypothetical protein
LLPDETVISASKSFIDVSVVGTRTAIARHIQRFDDCTK